MGERAIENRLRRLKALEDQISEMEEQAEAIRAEIKKDMEAKGQEEIKAGRMNKRQCIKRICHGLKQLENMDTIITIMFLVDNDIEYEQSEAMKEKPLVSVADDGGVA